MAKAAPRSTASNARGAKGSSGRRGDIGQDGWRNPCLMTAEEMAPPRRPNSYIETTIQGRRVGLVKTDEETTAFTFHRWSDDADDSNEVKEREFRAAYGSQDEDFVYGLIRQLMNIGSPGSCPDDKTIKFALAIVRGLGPRDVAEALLASQMAAAQIFAMKFANLMQFAEEDAERESAQRSLNKFMRTYGLLAEAFDRHRHGQRQIAVQQISVAQGAHAVIGDVHQKDSTPRKLNGHACT